MITPRQRTLIFVFAGVSALAGMAAIGFFTWKTIESVRHPAPSSGEDRKLVLTAALLGVEEIDPLDEHFSSIQAFDGSHTIEYSYSAKSPKRLYISSNVQVFPQSLTTIQMFRTQQLALRAGMALGGKTTTESAEHLLTIGDAHWAAYIKPKNEPRAMGNILLIRQGRVLHTIVVIGRVFNDPKEIEQLLSPLMAESERRFLTR